MARGQKRRVPVLGAAVACASSPEKHKDSKFRKLNLGSEPPLDDKSAAHVKRLECAAAALRPGLPKNGMLPCRAPERRKISSHLRAAVEQGGSTQVLYISGMPGTGKTAIVLEVLKTLALGCKFSLVHINAMRLGAPVQVFREVADQMDCPTSNGEAANDLTELFKKRQAEDPVVVLLIDEVDCLVTKSQAVLYRVFDWLGMPNARLVLAAISNTMDLPERLLPRVSSRFDIERVDFAPYNKDQIYEILCSRLKGQRCLNTFGDVVLRLCAARVASATGDIRKALQVCRRAVEMRLRMPGVEGPVAIADLTAAEKELILANPIAQAVLGLSTQARRFLSAVVIELRRKDADVVMFRKAVSRFNKLVALTVVDSERGQQPSKGQMAEVADLLDGVELLAKRFEAMGILREEAHVSSSGELSCNGPVFSLGSLDVEDLTSTLLKVEEDSTMRELLEGGRPGTEAARTFRPVD